MRIGIQVGIAAAMIFSSTAIRAECVPRDDQAAFSVGTNFQGTCMVLGVGDYPTATSTGLPNDSISSIRVGSSVQVYACRDENFAGACVVIHGIHATLANTGIDNAQITSLKVQSLGAPPPCDPGPLQVAFYVDANYAGDCRRLPVGDYPTATSTGLANDSVSSVRVGPGAQVRVCSDAYFAGTCVLLTANAPYLGNLPIGNDHLTSATVRPLGVSDTAQDFDTRCGDRNAIGIFNCTIHKPIVSRAEWVYQNVVFAPGDRVFVNGDGCVQTGGSGNTWKRYVNPGGGGADHLYHGLVRVPSGTLAGTDVGNTLTRIEHVVGRPITVSGEGMSLSQLVLHLGYEDDDFSDNGYDHHDDGTEDQCKGDNGNDGGPAHVTITICRKSSEPCTSMPSRFPFNVLSDQVDPNGFLYNPHWSWQDRQGKKGDIPSGSLCHDFAMRNASTNLGIYNVPNLPDCTDQAGQDTVDVPPDFSVNNVTCTFGATNSPINGTKSFGGHVNWFPVTVEGSAGPVTHEAGDDDYDFSLHADDELKRSLYLNPPRNFLHVEFDSDETVDNFKSDAWTNFHAAVDQNKAAQSYLDDCILHRSNCTSTVAEAQNAAGMATQRAANLFSGHAIATGLFGFDGEHGGKAELHPLYALATNVCTHDVSTPTCERDPNDEVWLMFLRNEGDEGFCSGHIWPGGFSDYTFRLPWRAGMTSVAVNWDQTQFEGTDGTSIKPEVLIVAPIFVGSRALSENLIGRLPPNLGKPIGVYITFHLGLPTVISASDTDASIPFIDGALHLVWKGTGGVSAGAITSHAAEPILAIATREEDADGDVEDLFGAAVEHLTPAERAGFNKASARKTTIPTLHRMLRGTVITTDGSQAVEKMTGTFRSVKPTAGPNRKASAKLARDTSRMRALCATTHGNPFGLSSAICTPMAKDHRTNGVTPRTH